MVPFVPNGIGGARAGARARNLRLPSIYHRERGGTLFEIATNAPRFAVDEPVELLGTALKRPLQFEAYREQIQAALPPLPAH